MENFRICPQCDQHLGSERDFGVLLCTCGWFEKTRERDAKKSMEQKTSYSLIASMVALVLVFGHLISWGEYSLIVPVLRLRQATGLLSAAGYNRLAQACLTTGRFACAENAYARAFEKSKKPVELLKLAKLQTRLGETQEGKESYIRYFKAGGQDTQAMVKLGQLLEAGKNETKALKMYQQAYLETLRLNQAKKRAELPIQAMSGIIRILMRQGRHREVYARIIKFHHTSETAKGYLNAELELVREVIRAKYQRSVASTRGS